MRSPDHDFYPQTVQPRTLRVERNPPLVDARLFRIVQSVRVPAVPMIAVIDRHIEAQQDDVRRAELDREVRGVKAAVPGPADFAEPFE